MNPLKPLISAVRQPLFVALLAGASASGSLLGAAEFTGNTATGFGGSIGEGSLTLSDDGTTLTGVITKGSGGFNDNLVLYIDSQEGGFADTSGFSDGADALRRAISGFDGGSNRSTLTFPDGFNADYAIALGPSGANFGGLWSLANGGANSLPFIAGVNLTPTGSATSATYTFSLPVSQLGLTANSGATFRILGTYVSGTGYRSDESLPGNVSGSQGWNAFTSSDEVTYAISRMVTSANDSGPGSLRQVVADAVSGDTILFAPALSGQTCTLTSGQILLNKNLTINASALAGGFILSGNNASRVFEVSSSSVVSLSALVIRNGKAPNLAYPSNTGGGIFNRGTLTVNDCTVRNCEALLGDYPGGGGIESNGTLTLNRCTIHSNSSLYGGGVESFPVTGWPTLTVNQCTIANNIASVGGGGINSGGTTVINQSTITGNTAGSSLSSSGGGIGRDGGTVTLFNSIVALNTATATPNIPVTFVSTGVNFVSGNPQLSTLGNYGGRTQTMPPLPGSPVIDAGDESPFPTDQRGLPIVGTPDIGAAEDQGNSLVATLLASWNLDTDGDGSTDGIEYALGTNATASDRSNASNLTPPSRNGAGANILSFGLNPNALPGTRWVLQRSSNLAPDSFSDVYTFDGTNDTAASGITVVRTLSSVTITDANAPAGKGFYRFKAQFIP